MCTQGVRVRACVRRMWRLSRLARREIPAGMPGVDLPRRDELEAVVRVAVGGFGGSPECEPERVLAWASGPDLRGQWSDRRRQAYLDWVIRFGLQTCDHVIVARREDDSPGGVCALSLHYSGISALSDGLRTVHGLWHCGLPPFSSGPLKSAASSARFATVASRVAEMHALHVPGPHLHVGIVSVSPDVQRQGLGDRLVSAASSVADRAGLACILETAGSRNRALYEKHGFVVRETATLTCDEGGGDLEGFHAMVRDAPG